ncbi:hypothetical protein B0H14DRAFT_814091 [Mycena olivaceomarginata]|nr:hypothetical protein B0H14DRAFT_814091 [Mycena olivaceomarginata]
MICLLLLNCTLLTLEPQVGLAMEVDAPSAGPSQVAVAQSASPGPGQMFHNATGFGIHGGQFMSVQGNVNIQPMAPYPTPQALQTMAPIVPSFQTTVYSESGNYSNQLLRQGRGFAVYSPKPQRNLAPEYRRKGVSIGDVGTITPQGTFDYFFNIYPPC